MLPFKKEPGCSQWWYWVRAVETVALLTSSLSLLAPALTCLLPSLYSVRLCSLSCLGAIGPQEELMPREVCFCQLPEGEQETSDASVSIRTVRRCCWHGLG